MTEASPGAEATASGRDATERPDRGTGLQSAFARVRASHPLLWVTAITTAIIFCLCAVWSLATPIGATNDEGSQVIKAVSVVRGQILGEPLTARVPRALRGSPSKSLRNCEEVLRNRGASSEAAASRCAAPFTVVTVPSSFTSLPLSESCNSLPIAPDYCPSHLSGSNRSVEAITYVGRYPPLYYAIVGLPSLVTQTDSAVYGMRLVSGLLTALLIGLAIGIVSTWSAHRLLLLAVAVAATPMLLVFGSAVNPSGLEMSSALCAWAGLLVLVLEHAERPPRSLVVTCTLASSVLVLCRAISPLWLVVMAVFVVLLRPSAIRSLASDRRVRIGSAVVALAGVAAVAYDVWASAWRVLPVGVAVPQHASATDLIQIALGNVSNWMYEFGGAFGWGFAHPPLAGIALLGLALSALVVGALATADARRLAVLLALIVTALVLPVVIVVSQATKDGIVWQARDGFPLYCGVVLVAGAIARLPTEEPSAIDRGAVPSLVLRRIVLLVATCVALSQFADVIWALRRYTVGLVGSFNLWANVPGKFYPPVSSTLLFLAALVVCAVYGWWIVRLSDDLPSSEKSFSAHDGSAPHVPDASVGSAHLPVDALAYQVWRPVTGRLGFRW